MTTAKTSDKTSVGKFWNRYLATMLERWVKESARRWYVLRAEQFIKAAGGKRLLGHAAENVSRHLGEWAEKAESMPGNSCSLLTLYRLCPVRTHMPDGAGRGGEEEDFLPN